MAGKGQSFLLIFRFKAMNQAPLFFIGFSFLVGAWKQSLLLFSQLNQRLPFSDTLFVFAIQLFGLNGRPSLFIQVGYFNMPLILVFTDLDGIPDFEYPTGFASLSIDMDLAAIDCISGKSSRLIKTGCPKPFIKPELIIIRHKFVPALKAQLYRQDKDQAQIILQFSDAWA
jgi:hypothetical protein